MSDTQNIINSEDLERAVRHLKDGGVVAMPTDTLYGLAADVFNPSAIDRVFAAKDRSENLALPVLVNGWEQAKIAGKEIPPQAKRLADRFWPGALTMVMLKADDLPDRLTAGGPTVAVRMPAHPVPIELINGLGGPITGTSANISGGHDPSNLEELITQMGNRVDYIIKSGPSPGGKASTVVDITHLQPKLLREGVIPFSQVLTAWNSASD
ncbi:MAG: L-threonylcarbamoyladenylate synthase [Chloroflexi bacterium]|nr:L-threonylcarbamoyladenylate synthase [Chloroflexota bacterium]